MRAVRGLALACVALVLLAAGSYAAFPVLMGLPLGVVRHESLASLREFGWWFSYMHGYLRQIEFNPERGTWDFAAARARLDAQEQPDPYELGVLEWHRGNFGLAVFHLEEYHRHQEASEQSLFWLGMSYMRQAEARNCLDALRQPEEPAPNGHEAHVDHALMCALPLTVHHRQEVYSRKAATTFQRLLDEYNPDDRVYRWLLNFSYMTIDAFPDEVPAEYRVDGWFVDQFYGEGKRAMEERFGYLKLRDRARELGTDAFTSGRGVAVEDFDRDGYLDVVTGGNYSHVRHYRNDAGRRFVEIGEASGLAAIKGTHLITAADYDNDGWVDVLASRPAGTPMGDFVLMRNDGDGTFTDVTVEVGLLPPASERTERVFTWATAWGDIDADGDLDLFVANFGFYNGTDEARHSNSLARNMDTRLYENQGGRFVDVTAESGLLPLIDGYNVVGAAFGDYDADGYADLAFTLQWLPSLVLAHNRGDGTFAREEKLQPHGWGFMTSFVDVNHDGLLDLFVGGSGSAYGVTKWAVFGEGNYRSDTVVWLQDASGGWTRDADFFGDMHLSTMGTSFGDVNNDGALDFYLGTGNPEGWMVLPNLMFLGEVEDGRPAPRTANVSMLDGLGTIQKGHGIVFFDYDRDGDQDVYSSLGGLWPGDAWPDQFFVNESELDARWTKIRLRGRSANYYGVGARIRVVYEDARGGLVDRYYHMDNKTAFGSAPYLAHVGLGDAVRIDRVEVLWPGERRPRTYAAELDTLNVLDQEAAPAAGTATARAR